MKTYKNFRYSVLDPKNWILEELVEAKCLRDTDKYKKGDPVFSWKTLGYFSSLHDLFLYMLNHIGLDGKDRDILKEIQELRTWLRYEVRGLKELNELLLTGGSVEDVNTTEHKD